MKKLTQSVIGVVILAIVITLGARPVVNAEEIRLTIGKSGKQTGAISWSGQTGALYKVMSSTNLQDWQVETMTQDHSRALSMTNGARFFRVARVTSAAGTLSVAKNPEFGDQVALVGATDVQVGSFVVSAGPAEEVSVDNLIFKIDGGANVGHTYLVDHNTGALVDWYWDSQDMALFSLARFALPALGSKVVDIYGDICPQAVSGSTWQASVMAAGHGVCSGAHLYTDTIPLQAVTIVGSGSLTIDVASADQVPAQIVCASAGITRNVDVFKFKLTAQLEAVDISRIIVSDTIVAAAYNATTVSDKPATSLYNFELWDGATKLAGPVSLCATTLTDGGYINFYLGLARPLNVAPGASKILTVRATVNEAYAISSGSTHQFSLRPLPLGGCGDNTIRAITAQGHDSGVAINGPTAVIAGNPITVRASYPVLTRLAAAHSLPAGSGDKLTIAKFKVRAVGGAVALKKITFGVDIFDTTAPTLLSFSGFRVYRNGSQMSSSEYDLFDGTGRGSTNQLSNAGTAVLSMDSLKPAGSATPNAASTKMVLVFTPLAELAAGGNGQGEEVIAAGAENTYEIKCDYQNAHQGATTDADSIVVQLLGEDVAVTAPHTGDLSFLGVDESFGLVGIDGVNYNFIWSDCSAGAGGHSSAVPSTGSDWTMGYQVRGADTLNQVLLPLDPWVLR